jgi:hypothetical protein
MNYASRAGVFETPNIEEGIALIEDVVKQAKLRRSSDFISRVFLFATPHFANAIEDLAHACISRTNCINIWGGCVSGLLYQGEVLGHSPAILIAIFGEEFEPATAHSALSKTIRLCLSENDQSLVDYSETTLTEPENPNVQANTMGILSYGANYVHMPRIEHGRLNKEGQCSSSISVENPIVMNSEGLEFLTSPMKVTESNGLFLIKIEDQSAAIALNCPEEQTKPVGLRLQVLHEEGESWIPVMSIHADGTICLVAPVMKGQHVRLARRTANAVSEELKAWLPILNQHFDKQAPKLGFLMAGFERSQMCNPIHDDVGLILNALPETDIIGIFGQACWLATDNQAMTPPRNNRLSLCLFNQNK